MIRAFHYIGGFAYELTMAIVRGPEQVTWISLVLLAATRVVAVGWLMSEWASYTKRMSSFTVPEERNPFRPTR